MAKWLEDAELADAMEESAAELAGRIKELTAEIKACEAAGDEAGAKRKKRLRRLCGQDRKQLLANAKLLRAQMGEKPPVGSRGEWRGGVPMERW